MTKQTYFLALAAIAAFFVSCTSARKAQAPDAVDFTDSVYVLLDTMVITPDEEEIEYEEERIYQATEERLWDLIHTKLDLSFDWPEEKVIGTATLTLVPFFYNQSTLILDAVDFNILHITVNEKHIKAFETTNASIIIPLDKAYTKDEEVIVEIQYEVQPRATTLSIGGAVTSNKGLFFIDPQDTIPNKPQQIWTQGETQYSSRWFPTLDQPNERGTQEIILTVHDTMMTLSNGLLISSTPLEGGMRRDHWKLDLPHAPYLAMVAVGQWDKETDYWRGRTVDYYVDPGYGPSARTIFQHTTEMLEFFSTKLNYDFVWPKYSQVIVKDFVTGAMENSSAVIYGDFVQFDKDDVIDEGINDYIVAHELFHQWFGDLVTCESWSNLTLNEGFANYGEYLWEEYRFGKERADITRLNELSGYYNQAENEVHPLIDFYYDDPQDMFDAHSYNKGGLVLHMLRYLVGEDAFYAGLERYLKQNEYSAVEVTDLRKAFESVTGQDLNWFFDQWYFGLGHPVLNIQHDYIAESKQVHIHIEQTQSDLGYTEAFILPMDIAFIYDNGEVDRRQIKLDLISQDFYIGVDRQPSAVVIDPDDIMLSVMEHDIEETEYRIRALAPLSINHRISAFRLIEKPDADLIDRLLLDSSYTMRLVGINHLVEQGEMSRVYEIAKTTKESEAQYYIMEALWESDVAKAKEIAVRLLEKTDKVPMIYSALMIISEVDLDEATHWLTHFESNKSDALYVARAVIEAKKGGTLSLDYFLTDQAANISEDYLEEFIAAMALFLSDQPASVQDRGLDIIDSTFYLIDKDQEYRRFFLITGLLPQYVEEPDGAYKDNLLSVINSLYQQETSPYLKSILKEGLGDLLED